MNTFEEVEILLIEDNPRDAELTIRALKRGAVANHVLWLKDGEQALDYLFCRGEYASRSNTLPRLVLLDLKMPRVDGSEVLKAIKSDERTKRIVVVIMTSSQEEIDLVRSYEWGANSYVVKPVDFNVFAEVARQAGYYWLAVNRTPPATL